MAEATTESSRPTGLTIQDLTLVLQVIQLATARGAFKAEDLTSIGGLYERIFKFLESVGAITKTPLTVEEELSTVENKSNAGKNIQN